MTSLLARRFISSVRLNLPGLMNILLKRLLSVVVVGCLAGVLTTTAYSQELPLGSSLPSIDGQFQRVDGSSVFLQQLLGSEGTVFLFWSNECPWVQKYESRVKALVNAFQDANVRFVFVNASPASAESLEESRKGTQNFQATYIYDSNARLARALGAARTPHAFLFDGRTLVYTGAIDDSPGNPDTVEKQYLRDAVQAVVSGSEVEVAQTKAFGCSLKTSE